MVPIATQFIIRSGETSETTFSIEEAFLTSMKNLPSMLVKFVTENGIFLFFNSFPI